MPGVRAVTVMNLIPDGWVMKAILVAIGVLIAGGPALALAPQIALPRPIACGKAVQRADFTPAQPDSAAIDASCPQWLSTGGVLPKRTTQRG